MLYNITHYRCRRYITLIIVYISYITLLLLLSSLLLQYYHWLLFHYIIYAIALLPLFSLRRDFDAEARRIMNTMIIIDWWWAHNIWSLMIWYWYSLLMIELLLFYYFTQMIAMPPWWILSPILFTWCRCAIYWWHYFDAMPDADAFYSCWCAPRDKILRAPMPLFFARIHDDAALRINNTARMKDYIICRCRADIFDDLLFRLSSLFHFPH